MAKITFVIGTRPELIKVAPIIQALKNEDQNLIYEVVNTAQHKELLEPYWNIFDIKPDVTLDIMRPGQSLSALTCRSISEIQHYLETTTLKPKVILAQGDTTTVMAAAIVSFYNRIKFAHLEAGLRSFDFDNPFPEEFNRKIASIPASIHFAPTIRAKKNLLREGISENKIKVVGNTVIDALSYIASLPSFKEGNFNSEILNQISSNQPFVLITCHRRENHGQNLENIIKAVNYLASDNDEVKFIWSVHPNPNVKNKINNSILKELDNVYLTPPLDYLDLLKVLDKSILVLTDSGGIQEEAPSFNVHAIVLRETTERPEGVEQGLATLVGADYQKIISTFQKIKNAPRFTIDENPYGNGKTSYHVINELKKLIHKSQVIT